MKKLIPLLLALTVFCSMINAQYRINKTVYDYRTWNYKPGDPYNPTICGVSSILIPGLGQMVAGETGRGFVFLGTYLGSHLIYEVGRVVETIENEEGGSGLVGLGLVGVGLAGICTAGIWATVDAVRVAKVNNLAWRDKYYGGCTLRLNPYIDLVQMPDNACWQAGISLKLNF